MAAVSASVTSAPTMEGSCTNVLDFTLVTTDSDPVLSVDGLAGVAEAVGHSPSLQIGAMASLNAASCFCKPFVSHMSCRQPHAFSLREYQHKHCC